MADASAALLLRAGAVDPKAVSTALDLKQREGVPLCEALVRLNLIDEERLIAVFQQALLVPRVSAAVLRQVPRRISGLLKPELAWAFRVVPVELDSDGNLTLAMADPTDNRAVDQVSAITQRFVMRAVAAPSAVREALTHHYGPAPEAAQPPPVVSALPPSIQAVPEASLPPRALPPSLTTGPAAQAILALSRALGPAPAPAPAESGPHRRKNVSGAPRPKKSGPQPQVRASQPPRPAGRLAAPVSALQAAQSRDEVVGLLLDYAGQLAARVGLFVIQQGQLTCLDGRGPDHVVVAMKWFTIPVDTPSPFRDVLQSRRPYIGTLQDTPESLAFRNALGTSAGELLLLPLLVGEKVVGVLYADEIKEDLHQLSQELSTLSREAGAAFARIILSRKRRDTHKG